MKKQISNQPTEVQVQVSEPKKQVRKRTPHYMVGRYEQDNRYRLFSYDEIIEFAFNPESDSEHAKIALTALMDAREYAKEVWDEDLPESEYYFFIWVSERSYSKCQKKPFAWFAWEWPFVKYVHSVLNIK